MTRLMTPFTKLVSADDALELILGKLRPVTGTEIVSLEEADGRVLAEDVKSTINVPAFDRAAMDGYAVLAGDLEEPSLLKEVGKAYAGKPFTRKLKPGECVEIATGAPIPRGADAVVMVERSTRVGTAISFRQSVATGENVGRKAEDIGKGYAVAKRGTLLGPGRIGAIAIVGKARVKVYKRPRVLVFTTGDEIQVPGNKLQSGQVYDCNSFVVMTIARRQGAEVTYRPNVKDTRSALKKVLATAAKTFDAIVFSGGTSVGVKDFGAGVLAELGRVHVHGVAIKPGKPLLFGTIDRCGVFGMPGYPTSCLLTAKLFLAPALQKLAHKDGIEAPGRAVKLGHEVKQDKTKQLLLPVKVDDHDVATSTFKGSSSITSLSESVGYIEVDAGDGTIPKGAAATVRVIQ